jgi:tetratricopeptide (TPR) repeat protein
MTRTRAALIVFAVLTVVGAPAPHAASESERQARRAFQEAESHFRAGRFAEALERYQAGYDQAPLPGFLINIAQCQRRLGDLRKARATYQKFVMVAPDSPHVTEVQGLIAELDKLIADLDAQPAAPAEKATAPPDAPAVAVLDAPAPRPEPAAPSLLASPPPPEAAPPPPRRRWWLWALAGAAVVGAGAAVAVLASSPGTTTIHEGTLATLRR